MRTNGSIVTLVLLVIQLIGLAASEASAGLALTAVALALELVLLLAYRNGWEPARYVFLEFLTLASGLTVPSDGSYPFGLLSAPAFAVIMGTPAWILGTAVVGYLLALGQTGMNGPYADIINVFLFSIPIGAIVLGRLVTETALRDAQASAQRAEAAGRHAEANR
jgi:alkylation response protein AidB-like acyl-CoA dehydrogenase